MSKRPMARNYVFTINYKWDLDGDEIVDKYDNFAPPYPEEIPHCRYMIYQEEIGENGTHHLQGYIQFTQPKRITQIKKYPGFERAHLEVQKGTNQEARDYCMKVDATTIKDTCVQYGTFNEGQGTRNDIKRLRNKIKEGATWKDLFDDDETLTPAVQYSRGAQRMMETYNAERKRDFKTIVEVYVGDTGTGKTRRAYDENPGLYMKPHSKWWDNYNQEAVVLFDDFYGWYPYHQLLIVLDRYACPVEYKSGYMQIAPEKIIITSNKHVMDWYKDDVVKDLNPLLRRIDLYVWYDNGKKRSYSDNRLDRFGVPIWFKQFQHDTYQPRR